MKTREDCLKKLRAEFPNATQAELHKKADAMMKEGAAEYSNTIKGVEIFATGTHNGDPYTEKDLDKIVSAFQELDYRPAIKIGHTKDQPGAPAYGWVQNVRRAGQKLIADFTDMHDSVVDAVRRRAYDNVSSEIYFNLRRGGKVFDRALKAVALLGAEVPAVAKLVPLHKMEFAADGEFEKVFASEMPLDVSPLALFECLNERMGVIIDSFTEGADMKTKAEQLKALTEQLGEVNAKLTALAGMNDKDKDASVKALTESVTKINAQIKELSEQDDDSTSARERAAAKAREEQTQKDLKAANDQIAELQADGRRRAVSEKIAALKVPAFRPDMEALYGYALLHNAEKVKVYSKDKDGKDVVADKTLVDIADGFVSHINSQAAKLFKSFADTGNVRREEGVDPEVGHGDAGADVDRLTKQWMRDKKVASYADAMQAVLEANVELAKQYADQTAANAVRHSN